MTTETSIKYLAFTMAEILISLTIIGIIAAITLPSLRANINEKTWATQRKALYSRMSQAIAMMPSLNGFGEFIEADPEHNVEGKDTVTVSFLTNGLSKVLDMRNICDNAHLKDCGLPDKIKTVNGKTYSTKPNGTNTLTTLSQLNPKFHGSWTYQLSSGSDYTASYNGGNIKDFAAAGFETKNGESVIAFYNPYCVDYETAKKSIPDYLGGFIVYPQRLMCANFIYDLNGKKGPNQVGKDIGSITAFYPTSAEIVMLSSVIYGGIISYTEASQHCKRRGDYRVPTREEAMSLFYNERLYSPTRWYGGNILTNEHYKNSGLYVMRSLQAYYQAFSNNSLGGVLFCIKR